MWWRRGAAVALVLVMAGPVALGDGVSGTAEEDEVFPWLEARIGPRDDWWNNGGPGRIDVYGQYAVYGRPTDGRWAHSGALHVFKRSADGWDEVLYKTGGSKDTFLGGDVAIDRDTMVVGKYGVNARSGAAEVFHLSDTGWRLVKTIRGSEIARDHEFGKRVDVHEGRIAVSAYDGAINGTVYIFERVDGVWTETALLHGSHRTEGDYFGLGLSLDGDRLAVSSPFKATSSGVGEVHVFEKAPSGWTEVQTIQGPAGSASFGYSVSLHGGILAVGDRTGSYVQIFEEGETGWRLVQTLTDGDDTSRFGTSVSTDGRFVAIGAPHNAEGGTAYIAARSDTGWHLVTNVTRYGGTGADLDLASGLLGVVSPGARLGRYNTGAAEIYGIYSAPPSAPTGLVATRGPGTMEVQLSWREGHGLVGTIDEYVVYRGSSPSALSEMGSTPGLSYRDLTAPCSTPAFYRVAAVIDGEVGDMSLPLEVHPEPRLDLLCKVNTLAPSFYWGPVDLNAPPGMPASLPRSLTEIENQLDNGSYPAWYHQAPARFSCCAVVSWDPDLLQEGPDERSYDVADLLGRVIPAHVAGDIGKSLSELGGVEATYEGFRFLDPPYLTGTQGEAKVNSRTDVTLDVRAGTTGIPATGTAGGTLVRGPNGELVMEGPSQFFVQAALKGFSKEFEREFKYRAALEGTFGTVSLADVEAKLNVNLSLRFNAMLGADLDLDDFQPRFVAGGAGADATIALDFEGKAVLIEVIGLREAKATGYGSLELRAETFVPLVDLPPGEPIRSPYTGIMYRDIKTPVVTTTLGPLHFGMDEITATVLFGGIESQASLDPPEISWEGAGFAIGDVSISSSIPFYQLGGPSDAAQQQTGIASTTPQPSDPDVVLAFEGTPGDIGNLSLSRPIAIGTPGDLEVALWESPVVQIEIPESGTGVVAVDTVALHQRATALAQRHGLDPIQTLSVLQNETDLNGDGTIDVDQGILPLDPRSPVSLVVDTPPVVSVDGAFDFHVEARPLLGGDTSATGVVEAYHNGTKVTEISLGQEGRASGNASVSGSGVLDLVWSYGGDGHHRRARTTTVIDARDLPPRFDVRTPAPLERIQGQSFNVTLESPDRDGIVYDVYLDDIPVVQGKRGPLIQVPAGGLGDGFHQLTVTAYDDAGGSSDRTLPIAIDRDRPTVKILSQFPLSSSHVAQSMYFEANEPVAARVVATEVATGIERVFDTGEFAADGWLSYGPLPAGAHRLIVEYADSAGNTGTVEEAHTWYTQDTSYPMVIVLLPT